MKFLDAIINSIGKLLGTIAYGFDIRHRRIVRRNLKFAYPNWSKEQIRNISHRVFQNIGITVLELFLMSFLSKEEILKKVSIKGREHVHEAIQSNIGVILISAHIGNWEMAHIFSSAYINQAIVLVARALDSILVDRWINGLRSKFGNIILYKKGALNRMARTLRQGGIVGLLIDQEARATESVPVSFFNGTVNATPSAALLARRYDCPVLPVFCVRKVHDNKLVLIVEPPLELINTKDTRSDLQINTQIMTRAIEKIVTAYPEQWFWVHKRWKRHHPNLYPEDMARHERRKAKKRAKLNKGKIR